MIEITIFSSFLMSFLPHIFNPHGSPALEMDGDGFKSMHCHILFVEM
jgi:hypothetical protein